MVETQKKTHPPQPKTTWREQSCPFPLPSHFEKGQFWTFQMLIWNFFSNGKGCFSALQETLVIFRRKMGCESDKRVHLQSSIKPHQLQYKKKLEISKTFFPNPNFSKMRKKVYFFEKRTFQNLDFFCLESSYLESSSHEQLKSKSLDNLWHADRINFNDSKLYWKCDYSPGRWVFLCGEKYLTLPSDWNQLNDTIAQQITKSCFLQ